MKAWRWCAGGRRGTPVGSAPVVMPQEWLCSGAGSVPCGCIARSGCRACVAACVRLPSFLLPFLFARLACASSKIKRNRTCSNHALRPPTRRTIARFRPPACCRQWCARCGQRAARKVCSPYVLEPASCLPARPSIFRRFASLLFRPGESSAAVACAGMAVPAKRSPVSRLRVEVGYAARSPLSRHRSRRGTVAQVGRQSVDAMCRHSSVEGVRHIRRMGEIVKYRRQQQQVSMWARMPFQQARV